MMQTVMEPGSLWGLLNAVVPFLMARALWSSMDIWFSLGILMFGVFLLYYWIIDLIELKAGHQLMKARYLGLIFMFSPPLFVIVGVVALVH
jgi:hypothetical protein